MYSSTIYQGWVMRDQGKSRLPIPILPEMYTLDYGNRVQTTDIAGLGEISLRTDRAALRVSFSSYFPNPNDPWIEPYVAPNYRTLKSSMWRFLFKNFLDTEKPIQIVFVGTPVNFHCRCDHFEIMEEGGAVGELNYNISFVEHRETGVEKVNVNPDTGVAELPPQEPRRLDTRIAPATYELKPGDSLAAIAKKIYGTDDAQTVQAIYHANKEQLSNPMLVKGGMKLQMPL